MQDSTTPDDQTPPLEPELQRAERLLRASLGEVCATDPLRADTAEMIRLDEILAIAGDAAKRAVSIRRRLRQEGRPASTRARKRADAAATTGDAAPAPAKEGKPPRRSTIRATERVALQSAPADGEAHRTFRDSHGVTWSVWAVRPMGNGTGRAELRGTFAQGWLAFVCEREKRRLSPVPDAWATMDDAALEALCGQAEVARVEAPTRRGPRVEPPEESA